MAKNTQNIVFSQVYFTGKYKQEGTVIVNRGFYRNGKIGSCIDKKEMPSANTEGILLIDYALVSLLFHRHTLGKITGLINITTAHYGHVI